MKNLRQSEIWVLPTLVLLSLGILTGCLGEDRYRMANGVCEPGTSQIMVWDGFLQNVCGCGGTPGEIIMPPAALTCTLPLGNTVYIHFQGPTLLRQLIPTGTPEFPASSIYDPNSDPKIYTHAFKPTVTGVHGFQDRFRPDFVGNFTVTP